MKLLCVLIWLVAFNFGAAAQDSLLAERIRYIRHFKNYTCIKLNPLSLPLGTVTLHREQTLGPASSVQLGFYYFSGLLLARQAGLHAVGITPAYRIYLKTINENGPFIEPFMKYQYFWTDLMNVEGNVSVLGCGFVVGRQWLLRNRKWKIDAFIGPLYNWSFFGLEVRGVARNLPNPLEETRNPFNGYWFRSGITIGRIL